MYNQVKWKNDSFDRRGSLPELEMGIDDYSNCHGIEIDDCIKHCLVQEDLEVLPGECHDQELINYIL